jgi:MoxR-like ATPase
MSFAGDSADAEYVSDEELSTSASHEYRPNPELVQLWHAVVTTATAKGQHPQNLMFLGPSGSGKTDGAAYLAALVGLPFTKVDAASMTDATDWFGTREVVEENGASVTRYRPSAFVKAVERPGVVLIDEVNRIRDEHRNVILPLTDGTHRVTNPLTGETVTKDPRCFIIMSGNRGLSFTGTFAIDPALMTRALVVDFGYTDSDSEVKIAVEATGVDEETAALFVRFANETRERAKADPDITPMSTREVLEASKLVAGGLSADLAVRFATMNSASDEGGAASPRSVLEVIWAGLRKAPAPRPAADES